MARPKKPVEEYTFIAIRVDDFTVRVGASINYDIDDLRWRHDDTPIYSFCSCIELSGVCSYPEERTGDGCHITLYSEQQDQGSFDARLKAHHVQDENGQPKYRKVRGKSIPVYDTLNGIGTLRKERGAKNWYGYIRVPEQTAAQMLTLLTSSRTVYIDIHELKMGRIRWIKGLNLQTTDPGEE